jgi:prevent-host-death family protein
MRPAPQIVPISDLRNRHTEVLKQLQNGPVFLTQHGRGSAVLLSLEQWDQLDEEIQQLHDVIAVLKNRLAVAKGEDEVVEADVDELMEWAGRVPS